MYEVTTSQVYPSNAKASSKHSNITTVGESKVRLKRQITSVSKLEENIKTWRRSRSYAMTSAKENTPTITNRLSLAEAYVPSCSFSRSSQASSATSTWSEGTDEGYSTLSGQRYKYNVVRDPVTKELVARGAVAREARRDNVGEARTSSMTSRRSHYHKAEISYKPISCIPRLKQVIFKHTCL